MSLVGKKVKVTFVNWPAASGYYTYEGHDDRGHWLRRKDGVQRYMLNEYVSRVEPFEWGDPPEERF